MANEISIKVTENFKKDDYDNFVYNNPNTSIFQTLEMAEVYAKNIDTEPLILAAKNEKSNEILASLLAKKVQAKKGFLSSFSLHSTIRGGPICKNTEDGVKAVLLLLQEYNRRANKWGVLYSRIYPLNYTPEIFPTFIENGYKYEHWNNFIISLNKPKEQLWANLKGDKKQGVNKAKKSGIKIRECLDKDEIAIFYDLIKERFAKRKNPLEDISNFEAVFDLLVPKNEAKIFFAEYKGECIATRLVLLYKNTIYAWYSGSKSEYLKYHPNDLLTWNVLEWGCENGFLTFDFGGGGELSEVGEGWVEFKRRFGSNMVDYGRYTNIHHPKKYWFSRKMFEIYKRIFI
jgi:serine/alanine adding enzyme